jgi:hypothetical protein
MPEATTQITIQAQDTVFQRDGSSSQARGYNFAGFASLVGAINAAAINSAPTAQLSEEERQFLLFLFSQDPQCLPGGLTLKTMQALVPGVFNGSGALASIYTKDPFSTQYETETKNLYERGYLIARSAAMSGPANVRGGTARTSFELAELGTQFANNRFREVWQNQMALAQLVIAAVQTANAVEAGQRADMLNAQRLQAATEQGKVQQMLMASESVNRIRSEHTRANAAGAEFLTVPNMYSEEHLLGRGFQQGVTTAFGSSYWR